MYAKVIIRDASIRFFADTDSDTLTEFKNEGNIQSAMFLKSS